MTYTIAYYRKLPGFFAFSALVLFLLFSQACKHKDPSSANEENGKNITSDTLPADFVAFFDKFHEDSAYQIAHILFPLEGLPSGDKDNDTLTTKRYFWQKAEWKKHNKFTDPSHQFTQWFEVINDRVIEHWIQMNGTNMFIHRRFAKLDDGWYLIYYAGLRQVKR